MTDLVDIFICGAAKSGTLMLSAIMRGSGYIDLPQRFGDTNYFTLKSHLGLDWYHGLFEAQPTLLRAESSPTYIVMGNQVADRILNYNPDAKFIFMLRNPVNRAWAQYWANVRKGKEPLAPMEAFQHEEERICGSESRFYRYGYKLKSRYHQQLVPYFERVDHKRILVVVLEKFLAHPEREINQLHRFLGLPETVVLPDEPVYTRINPGGIPRFQQFHYMLARSKQHFWHAGVTRRLWERCNRLNLVTWGKPYPLLDKNVELYLDAELRSDRESLINFLGWDANPWAASDTPEFDQYAQGHARMRSA